MRCADLSKLADLYVDGCLPEELRATIDRHLLRCGECAQIIRSLEQTRALLRESYPREEASPTFRERAEARLMDRLADVLTREHAAESGQWSLPFPSE